MLKPKPADDQHPDAGDSLRTLKLMIAGNVYQTEKHIAYCYDKEKSTYNFRDELKYIQPILSLGDVVIANLKTSFGGDVFNMFSAPDEFALSLKYSGINTVMHANLHTANVSRSTFARTRDLMNTFNIQYTGAFADNFQRRGNYPLIINKKGFRIAVLNYGALDNRPEISGNFYINEIDKDQIEEDFRMLYPYRPDFTIVYFDWGTEKGEIPSSVQIELARFCFQQGADLILGTNPNSPMRLDYMNFYRSGQLKEGIVAYSLGNLIASTEDVRHRNGYVIDMELKKNNYTHQTTVADWGIIPVYTYYDTLTTPGKTKVLSVPCSSVEDGEILATIPYIEKRRVINGAFEVRKLLGSTADEIQYNLTERVANNVMETIDLTNAAWNNRFAQKRAKEIAPTDAPLFVATGEERGYAPSISKIYGDEPAVKKNNTDEEEREKERKYEEEKKKAEEIFTKHIPTKYDKQETTNAPAITDTGDLYPKVKEPGAAAAKPTEARPAEKEIVVAPKTSGQTLTPGTKKEEEIKPVENKNLKLVVDTFYRIQFYALKRHLPLDTNYYTHLKGYEVIDDGEVFRYLLGKYRSYEECYKFWKSQMQPRYKESIIVKYLDGKRIVE
ncbi:MAG: CapA family protein [Chitinophagales bacterium]|nr:CapA family protein [Chitinophagales bacterium]